MKLKSLKGAPDLPAGWAWVNVARLGSKPRWQAMPWPSNGESWDDAAQRVQWHDKPFGGPAPYLGGNFADLESLVAQGYATRDAAGWYIPTQRAAVLPIPRVAS